MESAVQDAFELGFCMGFVVALTVLVGWWTYTKWLDK